MAKQSDRRARLLKGLGATTILAGMALPMLAAAQQAPASAPPQETAADNAGLGEIVVTATHEKQSVQKVPISMQALGTATLAEHEVKGLSDLATLLPSVSFSGLGPGRNTTYFRGIVPAGGNYASVGYYLDDIPITGTGVPDIHVYDIERVEALSGPQGTLYGAGSLGGTIRFVTTKPKIGKFEFGIDVEGNKYGGHGAGGQIESYVNVPLGDTVALRVMGYYRKDGGFVDNTPNNGKFNDGSSSTLNLGDVLPSTSYTLSNANIAKNNYNPVYEFGTRVSLLWEPAPGWEVTPEITAQRQTAYGYFGYDPRVGDLQVHDYDLTRNDDRWFQAEMSIHGHIGDFELTSATGYFRRKLVLNNDYTYYTATYDKFGPGYENYLQFFDKNSCTGTGAALKCSNLINPTQFYHSNATSQKFTQEVRLRTPKQWPFDVTVGGFYQSQQYQNNSNYAIHGLDSVEGYTEANGGEVAGGQFGAPAMYGITTLKDANGKTILTNGSPTYIFNTANVINPNGNPLGTMVLGSPAVKGDAFYINENDQYYHDEAVFAEGHYNILPNLKVTGGIRYFWTDYATLGLAGVMASAQSASSSLFVPTGKFGCPTPLTAARLTCLNTNPAAADEVGRYKEHGETHKAAIDWQIDPSKMLYANYSTGFRPGGFNRPLRIRNYGLATVQPFKSEKLANFEIGMKATFANIFKLNVSAYYETWNNIQYSVVVAGAQGAGITGNAGTAHVKGVEYDADLKLGKHVTLSSSGAYNDAKLAADFCNFAFNSTAGTIGQLGSCVEGKGVTNADGSLQSPYVSQVAADKGTRLPRQPKFKGVTTIRYDTMFGDYKAYATGSALYQTGATQNLNQNLDALLGDTTGFTSFDFTAGLKKGPYGVELFITNAFDKRGALTKNTFCSITFCSGSSRTFPIKPQFFGIKLSYRYQ